MKINDLAIEFTETSAVIPEAVSLNTWLEALTNVGTLKKSLDWWLADLVIYGEKRFGEDAVQYLDRANVSYATLHNLIFAAHNIPAHERDGRLSFRFHRLIATCPDATDRLALVKLAADGDWTYRQLAEEVALRLGQKRTNKPVVRIVFEPEELQLLRTIAHKRSFGSAADFIVRLVDDAIGLGRQSPIGEDEKCDYEQP